MHSQNKGPGTASGWAFLYARNRKVDYSFALLPPFLIADKAAQHELGVQLCGDPGDSRRGEFLAGATPYGVQFSVEDARIDGATATDLSGRPIIMIGGVIYEPNVDQGELLSLQPEFDAQIDAAWRQFWRDGKRPIIASTPVPLRATRERSQPLQPPDPIPGPVPPFWKRLLQPPTPSGIALGAALCAALVIGISALQGRFPIGTLQAELRDLVSWTKGKALAPAPGPSPHR